MTTRDIAAEAGRIALNTAPGAGGTAFAVKTAIDSQVLVSLVAGGLTVIFLVVQIGYAIMKWRRNSRLTGMIP